MTELSPSQRRALRARAHALQPVVLIGAAGLTDSVVAEIERSLGAHELIKIRAADGDRSSRDALLAQICAKTRSAQVQHIGKTLVLFRERPPDAESSESRRRPAKAAAKRSRRR